MKTTIAHSPKMALKALLMLLLAAATTTVSAQDSEILVGSLITRAHLVEGEVFILSDRVLEIRNFRFDGQGPAVYWWIDTNPRPSAGGSVILSPNNNCAKGYNIAADGTATIRVELDAGDSVANYLGGSFSLWCEQFGVSFGDLLMPTMLPAETPLDSLTEEVQCVNGMLVGGDDTGGGDTATPDVPDGGDVVPEIAQTPEGFNCEPLGDELQVRWRVSDDATTVDIDLVGMNLAANDYMAFGRSGSDDSTLMLGADVVVADQKDGAFRARDLYMSSRSFCDGTNQGVCPDINNNATNDASNVSGSSDFGLTQIRYTRPLMAPTDLAATITSAVNGVFPIDRAIDPANEATNVVWAIGPVNTDSDLPAFHRSFASREEPPTIHFGRAVVDNCEPLLGDEEGGAPALADPFVRPVISADTTEITAHIGPSGGERGFMSISGGRTPWGIAWYMNGDLVPTIQMRRGTEYTIQVNGGDDSNNPSEFHPMYLTTNPLGGYSALSAEERAQETVFAGIEFTDGATAESRQAGEDFESSAKGPICRYEQSPETSDLLSELSEYGPFRASLDTSCTEDDAIISNAGVLTFTPDGDTPDLIYYQCVTHPNLGWKIEILDEDDDSSAAASRGALLLASLGVAGVLFL